ncbi:hypothetical protein U9M48_005032 [Paspalum notatum var. saurae]|uniref:Leucine-rich repeat-containing N-terminal plant-type domain-containing protein n=1 Tax=Paspalum notatum var. saurae TaxID=547442 RepID=A0AAQ3SL85_PASNO
MVFITMCLLILSSLSSCSGGDINVQCLKDLKQSLGDPNGALSSWNFSRNAMGGYGLSQFAGVTGWPGDDNRIMLLNLSSMGLQGPIPTDISLQMPYVKYLDLSHNRFSGPIPGSLQWFAAQDIAGNKRLCGMPLHRKCKERVRSRNN